ncbi:MAG: Type IV pilus assembly protein PilB [Parcubacteria group bacterium GW2011_GWD2_43_10]|uniref:Bacterial type II secretion system protein E domain-containing protein n=4 Tax=Candidatus Vebleniibacteriota TaxID=1817921 RepID=A0A1G2Q6I5_9BACT|nr:MAG: Type IV pilus assembly protein PilB [Parcubacteria group bacterium GW2011_GWA2_42_80]KKS79178.1 MAG: Type IV pilus assembly protein PilB [Parcubacteria group bacterium GW2011_GWD1_42_9]KKS83748.1 MAG: Type IV pilus assembly protein PilB [Parcubacteria group bacterium GW2011_GWD2_43_10]KKS93082.1 MAG: Type IV pilus assembly protein PilB [Parcubacteria group bacterium GW2011_GWE2_43_12]KKT13967.1 MAG: Type IV pilus assembly protein PilB [Parcubacteria group bacterium GW2011_GWA1_43_27]KK
MPKSKLNIQLQDVLVAKGLLTAEKVQELEQAVATDGRQLEDILLERNLVKPADIMQAKSQLFNMPVADLVDKEMPREVIQLIPYELAENYQLVAFDRQADEVSVAMVNPGNFKAIEAIEFRAREQGWKPKYFITNTDSLKSAFKYYGSLSSEVKEALTLAEGKFSEIPELAEEEQGKLEEVVKTAPVAKMVAVIFRHAVEGAASDIHIEPVQDETRVRYRIDGVLHTSIVLPRYIHSAVISRIKVLANMKIDETRVPQDGRIRLTIGGRSVDFRVSTMPLLGSEKVVLRILDTATGLKSFEELGFAGSTAKLIDDSLKRTQGMFLVCGPTGSGKSTTLYTALNKLNDEGSNIITLEDPVEYYLEGVNQSQVNAEVGLTFASGLRSILRQDPDIIMVGEIRDIETADLAIHASLTGHIVLSTLHTNDALGSIPRLVDMHVEPFLLASTINVVVAQRLVRRICRYCVTEAEVPAELVDKIKKSLSELPPGGDEQIPKGTWNFKKGQGCARCNFTGYKGRVVIAEAFSNTHELQQIIVAGLNPGALRDEFKRQGMITMEQDGLIKVLRGVTTVEEVLSATND